MEAFSGAPTNYPREFAIENKDRVLIQQPGAFVRLFLYGQKVEVDGHDIYLYAPDECEKAMREFLNKLEI